MARQPLAYIVVDARPWGNIVTGIFKGADALACARRWACDKHSRIHRVMSEARLARLRVQQKYR